MKHQPTKLQNPTIGEAIRSRNAVYGDSTSTCQTAKVKNVPGWLQVPEFTCTRRLLRNRLQKTKRTPRQGSSGRILGLLMWANSEAGKPAKPPGTTRNARRSQCTGVQNHRERKMTVIVCQISPARKTAYCIKQGALCTRDDPVSCRPQLRQEQ